ncbi:MAG: glycoside hydrolase family 3 protein [Treponema sp.]|nr:glycoside hydrolase family 3 protein [Treponema sp.]
MIAGCSGGKEQAAGSTVYTQDTLINLPVSDPHTAYMRAEAGQIARNLDAGQLSAQVMLCGIDGKGQLGRDMQILLDECPAGGVILFRYNLDTKPAEIQNLITQASARISAGALAAAPDSGEFPPEGESLPKSKSAAGNESSPGNETKTVLILPFVAVDHEGGQVSRFNKGYAVLPAAAAYSVLARDKGRDGAIAQIEADAFRAGTEISALGINMNLAPVAELLNDYNREFLGSRSYGEEPAFVTDSASAFIRGMDRAGLLCVVKHFPGSAGKDPHLYPSVINAGIDELNVLAAPCISLIRGGQARAVMVSHTLVPARDPAHIASLSPAVMKQWLRDEIGFEGIIICDDFSMVSAGGAAGGKAGSAGSAISAELASLAAGADMIMVWPKDIRSTHRAIQDALSSGKLSVERLREAAAHIIFEKIRMGLANGG